MADLTVPAGTVLRIDSTFRLEPQYDSFRMGSNSRIVSEDDLSIVARRAEFGTGCVIDASGTPGAAGHAGSSDDASQGGHGGPGGRGHDGWNVTIQAALTKVGGLQVISNGGEGGRGGDGETREASNGITTFSGYGGPGGDGGNAGRIVIRWTPAAAELTGILQGPPLEHQYVGGAGPGGAGGEGGRGDHGAGQTLPGQAGARGLAGAAREPVVEWLLRADRMLWVQKQNMGPGQRGDHAMVWDPSRGRVVLFGGGSLGAMFGPGLTGDTWEWDGRFWTQVADMGPAARGLHGMTYDPLTGNVLLFGGRAGDTTLFADTWLWDGHEWFQVGDSGPAARYDFALSTDPIRQRVVLFGGGTSLSEGDGFAGDTWEWDGLEWIQRQDVGPSPRLGARMAFDARTQQTLLFGGASGEFLGDTWAWNGDVWRQVADIGPSGRMRHAMSADGDGIVLFGGEFGTMSGDTWRFRDSRWTQIHDFGPSPRSSHAMTYDEQQRHIVLFGGILAGVSDQRGRRDTWHLKAWPMPPLAARLVE